VSIELAIKQSKRGWDVSQIGPGNNVWPTTSYPNSTLAAARVLQLLELSQPVAPQAHPEAVCIGFIEQDHTS